MSADTVKVIGLRAQNVQRVEIVELKFGPEGGLEIISGANGSGKTTALNSIAAAVGGAKFALDVRSGCDKATSDVTLSNGIVASWTVYSDGRRSLTVKDPNNMRGTQSTLDAFISKFALNVPAFINASEKERLAVLLAALKVDPEPLRKEIKDAEETRTLIGREEIRMRGELASMDPGPAEVTELQSESEVLAKLTQLEHKVNERTAAVERATAAKRTTDAWTNTLIAKRNDLDSVKNLIIETQRKLDELCQTRTDIECEIKSIVDVKFQEAAKAQEEAEAAVATIVVPSSQELMKQLNDIRLNNAIFTRRQEYLAKKAAHEAKVAEYQKAGEKVEEARNKLTALTSGDKLGIPGLVIDEGELVYNGVQFNKLSDAEKLVLSAQIVRLENPMCGFMLVDGLEQMDSKTRMKFADWLKSNDIQCIGTLVSDDGVSGSIVIEDGKVLVDKRDSSVAQ